MSNVTDDVLADARAIAAAGEKISYPSAAAAEHVRSVIRRLMERAEHPLQNPPSELLLLYEMSGAWGDPATLRDTPGDTLLIRRVRDLARRQGTPAERTDRDIADAKAFLDHHKTFGWDQLSWALAMARRPADE